MYFALGGTKINVIIYDMQVILTLYNLCMYLIFLYNFIFFSRERLILTVKLTVLEKLFGTPLTIRDF